MKKNDLNFSFNNDAHVLAVDDNEINLELTRLQIEALGIKCDLANSGFEALDLVKNNNYDVIFMDHMMPRIDGIETAKQIRKLGGNFATAEAASKAEVDLKTPIIALTGNEITELENELKDGTLNGFLSKPINKEELLNILIEYIPVTKTADTEDGINSRLIHEKIDGIDIKTGLFNVAGNQMAYEKSINIFINKAPVIIKEMNECLKISDIKGFTIKVHGLKSSLASIGAQELSKLALNLEIMGKNNKINECLAGLPELTSSTSKLINDLSKIFKINNIESDKPLSDPEDYYQRIDIIKDLYNNYDIEGYSRQTEELLKRNYGQDLNAKVKQLKILIDTFDYIGIGTFLKNIKF